MIDAVGIAGRAPYALAVLRIVTGLLFLEQWIPEIPWLPAR